MNLRQRTAAALAIVMIATGCQAGANPSLRPSPSEPSTAASSPSAAESERASPSALAELPGTIAFARGEFPDPEEYFTIRPDGSNEHDLFSIQGCSCLQLSPDGSAIWTLNETAWGTMAFTTMRPDGTDKKVHVPPIKTLFLVTGPGALTPDGKLIAFYGWDDTRPEAAGVYLAAPDLGGLRRVIGLPDGFETITPYGVTPDGNRVLFYAERGRIGGITHTGDVFVVDASGDNLRKLNDEGWSVAEFGGRPASMSPDGSRATFAAFDPVSKKGGIFVVDLAGGQAQSIADTTDWSSAAAWAPSGDKIEFGFGLYSIVNADGTDRRELSPVPLGSAAWSPDGRHLAVARGAAGSRDLWIMDLDGNFLEQVTHQPGTYTVYDWR